MAVLNDFDARQLIPMNIEQMAANDLRELIRSLDNDMRQKRESLPVLHREMLRAKVALLAAEAAEPERVAQP